MEVEMCPFPVDPAARQRLHAAQRAETDGLKAVELAVYARDRAQRSLDAANRELDTARAALVKVSGLARAALLLNGDEAVLRRAVRSARSVGPDAS